MTDNSTQRPNIILFLVDDMGFADLGCTGSQVRTPNLNGLARGGVMFTQAYNCARCCPTRASLLTGLYPHQAGVGHMVFDHGVGPAYQGYLRDDAVTIAEALRAGGYQTLMSGKWHCGGHYNSAEPNTWAPGSAGYPYPLSRGFERFFGTLAGAGSYYRPYALMEQDRFIDLGDQDFYYTDAIGDHAVGMIEEAHTKESPFFLHVAYTAPHWPLHALEEDIARYENAFADGWDAERTRRHETLKGSGILDKHWPISQRNPDAPAWDSLPAKRREWESLRMAVYAAQVDRMDQGVGAILQALRRLGIEDNTLILFMSDNGGCAELLREDSGHIEKYNQVPPGSPPMRLGNISELFPGPADTFMSYDLPWANASNTPFRLFKHWVHEGGISTPLIASWPTAMKGGAIHHCPVHVIDIMATCLDAAGVSCPDQREGIPVQPLEGESFLPVIRGENWTRERPIFFEHEGNRAVRDGRWKIVSKYPGDWELYDMLTDRTEVNDLSAQHPEQLRTMKKWYDETADQLGVIDWSKLPYGK